MAIGAPGACLVRLVSASCTIRYAAWSAAGASGRASPERRSSTSVPAPRDASTSAVDAGHPAGRGLRFALAAPAPRYRPAGCRRPRAARASRPPTPRAAPRRPRAAGPSAPGPPPARPVCTAISASWWPRLSCMSWAIRWRSRMPRVRGDHLPLPQQLGVVLVQRVQEGAALGAVATGEAGHDRRRQEREGGEQQRRQRGQPGHLLLHGQRRIEDARGRERRQRPPPRLDPRARRPARHHQQGSRIGRTERRPHRREPARSLGTPAAAATTRGWHRPPPRRSSDQRRRPTDSQQPPPAGP